MLTLTFIAIGLSAASLFLFFGVPYLILGPGIVDQWRGRPEARVMGYALATLLIAAMAAPFVGTALISAPQMVQVLA